jgi:hypothetical protein
LSSISPYIRNIIINQIAKEYFPSHSNSGNYGENEFKILSTKISNFNLSPFTSGKGSISSKTIRNFYQGKNLNPTSLSTLVLVAFKNDTSLFNYLKNNFVEGSEFKDIWTLFENYFLTKKTNIINEDSYGKAILNNSESFQFSDPLLFIFKKLKKRPINLYVFYVFFYQLIIIIWAFISDVWDGIDYPLKESLSAYIGYLFYAICATQLTLFNFEYRKFILLSPAHKNNLFSKYFKFYTAIAALFFTFILHYNFLTDDLHGWCEKEKGIISTLGIYHFFISTFNLWIVFNFIYYFISFPKVLNLFDPTCFLTNKFEISFIEKVLKSISKINIIYKNIIISYGLFAILFFVSIINFELNELSFNLELWQKFEIVMLTVIYLLFGFILYWKKFLEICNNFLSTLGQNISLPSLMPFEVITFISSLPKTPNEIENSKSSIRIVFIWTIAIIIIILIIQMLYFQWK